MHVMYCIIFIDLVMSFAGLVPKAENRRRKQRKVTEDTTFS